MAELNARIACTEQTRSALKERAREDERYEDVLVRLLRATEDAHENAD